MENSQELIAERLRSDEKWTITAPPGTKLCNQLIRYAKEYPDKVDCTIYSDGGVLGHVPKNWFGLHKPREMSEEQKAKAAERLRAAREKREADKKVEADS